ncbi:MAG: 50S ribosomal protein L6 [Nitrospinae bacterium]|nr:50S ribosomal protein L6 [Nitrospinota bacterium]
MSRIGKQPINIPKGVEVKIEGSRVDIKGPKGSISKIIHPNMKTELLEGKLFIKRSSDSRLDRSLHGLTRTIVSNMVFGVTEGFSKQLIIEGVGYRASLQGKTLVLTLGYSHPVNYNPPNGISIEVGQKNEITVKGIDKELVGQVAANIRDFREPDSYKGKGIRYSDEVIHKKPGKAAASASGTK